MACQCDEVGDNAKCWLHGDGTPWAERRAAPATAFSYCRAMPTAERAEKLGKAFSTLREKGQELTRTQESVVWDAMELRRVHE